MPTLMFMNNNCWNYAFGYNTCSTSCALRMYIVKLIYRETQLITRTFLLTHRNVWSAIFNSAKCLIKIILSKLCRIHTNLSNIYMAVQKKRTFFWTVDYDPKLLFSNAPASFKLYALYTRAYAKTLWHKIVKVF